MKKLISILLTLFLTTKCVGQIVDTTICINCSASTDSLFIIDEISDSEFHLFRKNFRNKLIIDSSKIEVIDTVFILETAKTKLSFNTEYNKNYADRRGFTWSEYRGFIKDLKLYVLEDWWAGEFVLGESFLIDSVTNVRYNLKPLLDGPNEPPLVSPGNKYLISYANDITAPEGFCRFSIVKISKLKGVFKYGGYMDFESDQWSIVELVWVNDTSFAIKGNSKTYNVQTKKWLDNFNYLKFTIPDEPGEDTKNKNNR